MLCNDLVETKHLLSYLVIGRSQLKHVLIKETRKATLLLLGMHVACNIYGYLHVSMAAVPL